MSIHNINGSQPPVQTPAASGDTKTQFTTNVPANSRSLSSDLPRSLSGVSASLTGVDASAMTAARFTTAQIPTLPVMKQPTLRAQDIRTPISSDHTDEEMETEGTMALGDDYTLPAAMGHMSYMIPIGPAIRMG